MSEGCAGGRRCLLYTSERGNARDIVERLRLVQRLQGRVEDLVAALLKLARIDAGVIKPVSYTHLDVYKRQGQARGAGALGHLDPGPAGASERARLASRKRLGRRRGGPQHQGAPCLLYTSRCV